ncbi:MAG: hypothetical protein J0L93_07775 [Deltaproteobacteria bacterium]|nr:hypothetical protein [Deltaproteobacteria bacterium]
MTLKNVSTDLKKIVVILFSGFLLYCGAMIVIRLSITQMAYQFEELKNYERSLKEEQLRLRAGVSKKISPALSELRSWKEKGFAEPAHNQVVVIP